MRKGRGSPEVAERGEQRSFEDLVEMSGADEGLEGSPARCTVGRSFSSFSSFCRRKRESNDPNEVSMKPPRPSTHFLISGAENTSLRWLCCT